MTPVIFLIIATAFLAYANGANDNFKGVATLYSSGTTSYRTALIWATATTFMGSMCALLLAKELLRHFSGKGLVPETIATSPVFLFAVAMGAGATVLLAALRGFPISTTHGLTGALVGAGFMAVGTDINTGALVSKFLIPLLVSPLIALILSAIAYYLLRTLRIASGVDKEYCLCVGDERQMIPVPASAFSANPAIPHIQQPMLNATIAPASDCQLRYRGYIFGIHLQKLLDIGHFASAGMVGFARGLNDTPKIMAVLVASQALSAQIGLATVALAMALGGLLHARRVATTMSHKITTMNHGQGFTANMVTALMVVFASRIGVPVSTTHVSVGSIFGIGLLTKQADRRVIGEIMLSWLLTLPIAAAFSAAFYFFQLSLQ